MQAIIGDSNFTNWEQGFSTVIGTAVRLRGNFAAACNLMSADAGQSLAYRFMKRASEFAYGVHDLGNYPATTFAILNFMPTGKPQSAPHSWVEFMARLDRAVSGMKANVENPAYAADDEEKATFGRIDFLAGRLTDLWPADKKLQRVIESYTQRGVIASLVSEAMKPVGATIITQGHQSILSYPGGEGVAVALGSPAPKI